MTGLDLRKTAEALWLVAIALIGIAATVVGGFQLRVEVPQDQGDAVLLVRTYGCHQPEDATVSGTAEGIVEGRRVSTPIRLEHIAKGVYSVEQQWPESGNWVLALSGTYNGLHTSTLVSLDAGGKVAFKASDAGLEPDIRVMPRKLTVKDIEGQLQRNSHAKTMP